MQQRGLGPAVVVLCLVALTGAVLVLTGIPADQSTRRAIVGWALLLPGMVGAAGVFYLAGASRVEDLWSLLSAAAGTYATVFGVVLLLEPTVPIALMLDVACCIVLGGVAWLGRRWG